MPAVNEEQTAQTTEVEREKPADVTPSEVTPAPITEEEQAAAPDASMKPEEAPAKENEESLPATAGELPLLALLGLSCLGLGKALRR